MSERDRGALLAALEPITGALHAAASGGPPDAGAATSDSADGPALAHLVAAFSLTRFERDVIVLCAGAEVDPTIAELCRAAGAPGGRPTFGLALGVLAEPHWSALAPGAPLRRFALLELEGSGPVTHAPLGLAERILHFVMGLDETEAELARALKPVGAPAFEVGAGRQPLVMRVAAHVGSALAQGRWPLVELIGGSASARQELAAATAHRAGLRLDQLEAAAVVGAGSRRDRLRAIVERETRLGSTAVLVADELEGEAPATETRRLLEELECPVFVSTPTPLALDRTALRLEVPGLSTEERRALWSRVLGVRATELNGTLDQLAAQFDFGPGEMATAAAQVTGVESTAAELWGACRLQARPRLDDLAARIDARTTWEDLVLPGAQLQTLHEIAAHVRQRSKVYEGWGFAAKSSRGLGIGALFAGASGTGKTMAAEVLATELDLDLYRIDLSAVVSKYIGETEKNLRRVFDAAEGGAAILLFDEADALFGKRTEVRDSHDRFANIEISYLLQRMEAYRGLAILTTNMQRALDSAFLRRIRFVVQFPFPDVGQREEIWRRVFPAAAPLDGVDPGALAALDLSGGSIRNVALNAAFLAADADQRVSAAHLERAAQSEYAKLGRSPAGRRSEA